MHKQMSMAVLSKASFIKAGDHGEPCFISSSHPPCSSLKEMWLFLLDEDMGISHHWSASEPEALTAELRAAVTTLHSFVSLMSLSLGCITGLKSTGLGEKTAQDHEMYISVVKKYCDLSIIEMTEVHMGIHVGRRQS